MSRGYGWVERRVLGCLDSDWRPLTATAIANWVYRNQPHDDVANARQPTSAEIVAVKRALRGLERKGEPISGVIVCYRGARRTYWARNDVWDAPVAGPRPVRARLVKLLGLTGSQFEGERANAAFMAEKLRREIGLSWEQLIVEGIDAYAA